MPLNSTDCHGCNSYLERFAQSILVELQLDRSCFVLEGEKGQFAKQSSRQNASGHCHVGLNVFLSRIKTIAVFVEQLRRRVSGGVCVRKRFDARLAHGLNFAQSDRSKLGFGHLNDGRCRRGSFGGFGHFVLASFGRRLGRRFWCRRLFLLALRRIRRQLRFEGLQFFNVRCQCGLVGGAIGFEGSNLVALALDLVLQVGPFVHRRRRGGGTATAAAAASSVMTAQDLFLWLFP